MRVLPENEIAVQDTLKDTHWHLIANHCLYCGVYIFPDGTIGNGPLKGTLCYTYCGAITMCKETTNGRGDCAECDKIAHEQFVQHFLTHQPDFDQFDNEG